MRVQGGEDERRRTVCRYVVVRRRRAYSLDNLFKRDARLGEHGAFGPTSPAKDLHGQGGVRPHRPSYTSTHR